MKISQTDSNLQILREIGIRCRKYRISDNITRSALAEDAGVSMKTLQRFEEGVSIQFINVIRILKALGIAGNLDSLLIDDTIHPVAIAGQNAQKETSRSRARAKKRKAAASSGWVWGDERSRK